MSDQSPLPSPPAVSAASSEASVTASVSVTPAASAVNGMEDVIISTHRQMAVRKELLDCDYYRLLSGDPGIHFTGEYMNQYSWAEPTAGRLSFGSAL